MKDENFYVIQGWMINKLKLKGNELLVYSIIYGFSQDGGSVFSGSQKYLAECCGCSVRSIQTTLNNLVDKKYITKYEEERNGVKFCSYVANFGGTENFSGGTEKIADNNIVNNIVNKDISKDISGDTKKFQFGKSSPKQKKRTNSDEYENALVLVQNYTDNTELISKLNDFVLGLKELKGKQRYKFYSSTIKNYLDELTENFGSDEKEKIEAVKLSIRYNYTTKVMKPYNTDKKDFNVKRDIEMIEENDYDKYDHTKSERSF